MYNPAHFTLHHQMTVITGAGGGGLKDMANAALYLCSPAASWVSGQILTVSGGGLQELD